MQGDLSELGSGAGTREIRSANAGQGGMSGKEVRWSPQCAYLAGKGRGAESLQMVLNTTSVFLASSAVLTGVLAPATVAPTRWPMATYPRDSSTLVLLR